MLKNKKERLLQLFKHYMITSYEDSAFVVYNTPLDCQIISTSPNFIISDGFHKVPCQFTKEAMIILKQYYPTLKIEDLDKRIITLIEYMPLTHYEKKLSPILHVHDFYLDAAEEDKHSGIVGKPKVITKSQEMRRGMDFEIQKHFRSYLANEYPINVVPPLERILLENQVENASRAIACGGKKREKKNKAGKVMYAADELLAMDDGLTEAAGRLTQKQKDDKRKNKERARKVFKDRKEKPRSLDKDLMKWAKNLNEKRGKMATELSPDFVKEGVAKVIARNIGNPIRINLKSASKSSINKSINSKKGNTSEVKFNAKGFKNFMSWNKGGNSRDLESNDVGDVLKKGERETIQVDFAVPIQPSHKAFDGWLTSGANKRRKPSDGSSSCKKSTAKKPRL